MDGRWKQWNSSPRWVGIKRDYDANFVKRLRGPWLPSYDTATLGAESLWSLLQDGEPLTGLGAVTGNQALQQIRAGLKFVYVSGWQIAADNNLANQMLPDLSLYPNNSGPRLVEAINAALIRSLQLQELRGDQVNWLAPVVIDAEAGFGGILNTFELCSQLIKAGAAGIHFEDQAPQAKRCGHLGGKVIIPASEALKKLKAARLAADVLNVPLVLIGRTDAYGAKFITSDHDPVDKPYLTGERSPDGLYALKADLQLAIDRALTWAPYVDVLWCETGKPDLEEARVFAEAIHKKFPEKPLVYNLSPSFNWQEAMTDQARGEFQEQLAALGYKIQLITLAGFHTLNYSMYTLAKSVSERGLPAYVDFQGEELAGQRSGFTAAKHQQEVGTAYYDQILAHFMGESASTLGGSSEQEQF